MRHGSERWRRSAAGSRSFLALAASSAAAAAIAELKRAKLGPRFPSTGVAVYACGLAGSTTMAIVRLPLAVDKSAVRGPLSPPGTDPYGDLYRGASRCRIVPVGAHFPNTNGLPRIGETRVQFPGPVHCYIRDIAA